MNPYQHKVQYYETDKMGIVHHSNYVRWMEEARIDYLSQIGCDYDKMEEQGIISPVSAIECKYKVSAKFPEVISIAVSIEEFRGVKLKLKYEMKNGEDAIVCEGHSEHGFLNRDGKIISLKRECPEIYEAMLAHTEKKE